MSRLVPSALLPALAAASLLSGAAFGQARGGQPAAPQNSAPTRADDLATDDLLWGRGREVLHQGEPLFLRGVELGENSFRESTPALEKSDRAAAYLDLEELRVRKLAMYGAQEVYSAPPKLSAASSPEGLGLGRRRGLSATRTSPGMAEPLPEGGGTGIFLAAMAVMWLLGIFARGRRSVS